jgi:hypothetical protein
MNTNKVSEGANEVGGLVYDVYVVDGKSWCNDKENVRIKFAEF